MPALLVTVGIRFSRVFIKSLQGNKVALSIYPRNMSVIKRTLVVPVDTDGIQIKLHSIACSLQSNFLQYVAYFLLDLSLQGESLKAEDLQKFYQDNIVPLVGQMTQQNEEKRYKNRPLVIVYYGIDFSFEHREGKQE